MNVLHLLYQSYPNVSGSSTRSRSIINAQKKIGINPVVLTSPFQKGLTDKELLDLIDGTKYYRCYLGDESFTLGKRKTLFIRVKKLFTIFSYFFHIMHVAKVENAQVIHSHAMFYNALPGMLAAFILRIPHVYEIRSDWSSNSHFKSANAIKYVMGMIEIFSVRFSGAVVVISKGLFNKYSRYNKRTLIIGNAVDDEIIDSNKKSIPVLDFQNLRLAYIGSVIPLEGLNYVLEALSMLSRDKFTLKVVGGGGSLDVLKKMVTDLDLVGNVEFTGVIPPSEVFEIYNEIDVIINYRRDEPVSHNVTPLKPLEAMAYRKLVIASDVKGMTELVEHMVTGIIVRSNDSQRLALELTNISNNVADYRGIQEAGFQYVSNHKSWGVNALNYKKLYSELLCNK